MLREGVNLAVWIRRLSPALRDSRRRPGAQPAGTGAEPTLEMEEERPADGLLDAQQLPGQTDFLDDLGWLVEAFSCLTGARRIGLRLRVLDKPMCPRFPRRPRAPAAGWSPPTRGAASEWPGRVGWTVGFLAGAQAEVVDEQRSTACPRRRGAAQGRTLGG